MSRSDMADGGSQGWGEIAMVCISRHAKWIMGCLLIHAKSGIVMRDTDYNTWEIWGQYSLY
jgi:hypothetical protein